MRNMKKEIAKKIITELYEKETLTLSAILKLSGSGQKNAKTVKRLLSALAENEIIAVSKGNYHLSKRKSVFKATVKSVFRAHGFIQNTDTGEEFFVPGRYLCAAIPGDIVLARPLERETSTARVIVLMEESKSVLTGTIVSEGGRYYLLPHSFVSEPLPIMKIGKNRINMGDKVSFSLCERGERHSEHIVNIETVYGNAEIARIAAEAYLDEKNIPAAFAKDVAEEAQLAAAKGVPQSEINNRLDLTALPIFTIDGADTKDIDDAVYVKKVDDGFELGVHIADVSHYVKKNSPLDKEAFLRGTSVYIADFVIPMLPKELSNGICSLNPGEERLAFSCLMKITEDGKLDSFKFVKSVIKSRVQGVYSEINTILEPNVPTPTEIVEKYAEVSEQLETMNKLASLLKKNRVDRGAPEISSAESKVICENGVCVGVKAREGGQSEGIIEEFMLAANNAAARLAMENNLPFIFRVHEAPTAEKLAVLNESLTLLGVDAKGINERSSAGDLARILRDNKDSERFVVINNLVLRSMMKAAYSPEPIGHFGLVIKEYTHFTSPIRRYPDLFIHRVLSDFLEKLPAEKMNRRYKKQAFMAAAHSSSTELSAINAERDCVKFYMAEYMKGHIGEEFDAIISGVAKSGIFVLLDNTVEGRVGVTELAGGIYTDLEVINSIILKNQFDGKKYVVGDKLRVKCENVSISAGLIDFSIVSYG